MAWVDQVFWYPTLWHFYFHALVELFSYIYVYLQSLANAYPIHPFPRCRVPASWWKAWTTIDFLSSMAILRGAHIRRPIHKGKRPMWGMAIQEKEGEKVEEKVKEKVAHVRRFPKRLSIAICICKFDKPCMRVYSWWNLSYFFTYNFCFYPLRMPSIEDDTEEALVWLVSRIMKDLQEAKMWPIKLVGLKHQESLRFLAIILKHWYPEQYTHVYFWLKKHAPAGATMV